MHVVCAITLILTTHVAHITERSNGQLTHLDAMLADVNGDAVVSIQEAVSNLILLEHFATIDSDGNGLLDASELSQVRWPILLEKKP